MTSPTIRLKTFIGYQIKSKYHTRKDFKLMGEALNGYLNKLSPRIQLEIEFGEFPPGARLWDEVISKIASSHVTIFDISENNPNVLLEAGMAFGMGNHVVFLRSNQSDNSVPSDLKSFIYLPYQNKSTLLQESFLHSIADSIKFYLERSHDPYFYHRLLWSLNPVSNTVIVPGRLPENRTGNRFEDYIHIRTYSDLDAVFSVIETIHRLYPKMNISIQSANAVNDLPKNWEQSNIIVIGGPDFNHITKEFEDLCPIEYKYGPGKDDIWLLHKITGVEYRPEFYTENGKNRAKDYGFFLKINPGKFNTARMIFIGGAHAWGVYGAAMLLSCKGCDKSAASYINAKVLTENFGSDPSLLIPVEVNGSKHGIRLPVWSTESVELINDA